MISYKLLIWYRYTQNGEQEKECEYFEVEADNVHDAFRRIKLIHFPDAKRIPISYKHFNNEYRCFSSCVKDEAFNEKILNKEY